MDEKFQNVNPLTNWMFPVIKYKDLPNSFSIIPNINIVESPGTGFESDTMLLKGSRRKIENVT